MLDPEVIIAPSLELGIVFRVVLIAGLFERAVKVDRILFIQVVGSEVTAAAKPPPRFASLPCFEHLEISVVEVQGWHMRIPRVDDGADATGEEGHLLALWQFLASCVHLSHSRGRDHPMDHGHSDSRLLKDVSILNDTSYPTASLLPLPPVHSELVTLVLLSLKSPAELALVKRWGTEFAL